MPSCPSCGKRYPKGTAFCPHDGVALSAGYAGPLPSTGAQMRTEVSDPEALDQALAHSRAAVRSHPPPHTRMEHPYGGKAVQSTVPPPPAHVESPTPSPGYPLDDPRPGYPPVRPREQAPLAPAIPTAPLRADPRREPSRSLLLGLFALAALLGAAILTVLVTDGGILEKYGEPDEASHIARAQSAADSNHWTGPGTTNVVAILDAAHQKWPQSPRVQLLREELSAQLLAESLRLESVNPGAALHHAELARQVAPKSPAAQSQIQKLLAAKKATAQDASQEEHTRQARGTRPEVTGKPRSVKPAPRPPSNIKASPVKKSRSVQQKKPQNPKARHKKRRTPSRKSPEPKDNPQWM